MIFYYEKIRIKSCKYIREGINFAIAEIDLDYLNKIRCVFFIKYILSDENKCLKKTMLAFITYLDLEYVYPKDYLCLSPSLRLVTACNSFSFVDGF